MECLKDPAVKKHILKMIGKTVHQEIRHLASDSINLKSADPEDIKTFTWNRFGSEISKFAPVLGDVLQAGCRTKQKRPNAAAVVCICVALLVRNRNSTLNLMHKIVSLILYAGHTSKQVQKVYVRIMYL